MDPRVKAALLWATVTVAAVAVANAAIGQVYQRVRLEPVPVSEAARVVEAADAPTRETSAPGSNGQLAQQHPGPASPSGSGPDSGGLPGITSGVPPTEDSVEEPPAAVSARPPRTGTIAPPESTPSPSSAPTPRQSPTTQAPERSPAPAAETRTYSLVGGEVSLRFDGDRVEVLWATPNRGFNVEVETSPDGSEVSVRFRSDTHRSRVKASAQAGRYRDEVEERPE